jgi:hypothetical protein
MLRRFSGGCAVVREMVAGVEERGEVPTLADIAGRLNLSVTTVHRRLAASRKALAALRAGLEAGDPCIGLAA